MSEFKLLRMTHAMFILSSLFSPAILCTSQKRKLRRWVAWCPRLFFEVSQTERRSLDYPIKPNSAVKVLLRLSTRHDCKYEKVD